jgi:hypothetical protein
VVCENSGGARPIGSARSGRPHTQRSRRGRRAIGAVALVLAGPCVAQADGVDKAPPSVVVAAFSRPFVLKPVAAATGLSRSEHALQFSRPAGARDGGTTWYLLRLRADIYIRPGARRGSLGEVAVSSDGRTGISALVQPVRVRSGPPATRLDLLDLLQGYQKSTTRALAVHVDEWNYGQISGVHPGINDLVVSTNANGALIRSVTVLPGTGVYVTRLGPSQLTLHAPQRVTATGSAVTVPVSLVDTGDTARRVVVHVVTDPAFVTVRGSAARRVGDVTPSAAIRLTVPLALVRAEPTTIGIAAVAVNTHATATVTIQPAGAPHARKRTALAPATGRDPSGNVRLLPLLLGGLLLLGAVGLGLREQHRRTGDRERDCSGSTE